MPSLAPMLEKVMPSVVSINVEGSTTVNTPRMPRNFQQFFGDNSPFCQDGSPFQSSPFCQGGGQGGQPDGGLGIDIVLPQLFASVGIQCDQVVVRGTCAWSDFVRDVDALQVPFAEGEGKVHRGFYDAARQACTLVEAYMDKFHAGQPVLICGHSLGGAVALILAQMLRLRRSCEVIGARGPFLIEDERELFERRGIDVLISKNSGSTATEPKLEVARALGVPVLVLKRPVLAAVDQEFTTVPALLQAITTL